jgi:peptidoglycan/xylan/chitin deacetylase (PgdA/CDA1 family)
MPIFFFILLGVILVQSEQIGTPLLFQGSRFEKKIALTFDACPSSTLGGYDSRIVRTLVDSGVTATFFFSGSWILRHRSEAKMFASIPYFEVGNHSYSHPHCKTLSDDSISYEIQRTECLLKSIGITSAKLFRPPYGEIDERIERIVNQLGLSTAKYDFASGDPDSTISKERLINYVVSRVRNGSIVVMHVNGRGWHTAEALPEIIQSLRKKGFIFVKVSELLKARHNMIDFYFNRKNL